MVDVFAYVMVDPSFCRMVIRPRWVDLVLWEIHAQQPFSDKGLNNSEMVLF